MKQIIKRTLNKPVLVVATLLISIAITAIFVPIKEVTNVQIDGAGWSKQQIDVPSDVLPRGAMDVTINSGSGTGLEIALPVDGVGRWSLNSIPFDSDQWAAKGEDRIVSLVPNAVLHWQGEFVSPFSIGLISQTEPTTVTLTTNEDVLSVKVKANNKFRNASFMPDHGEKTSTVNVLNYLMKKNKSEMSQVWWGNHRLAQDATNFELNPFSLALSTLALLGVLLASILSFLIFGFWITRLLDQTEPQFGLEVLSGLSTVFLVAGALNYFVNGRVVSNLLLGAVILGWGVLLKSRSLRFQMAQRFKNIQFAQVWVGVAFLGISSTLVVAYNGWTVGLAQTDVFDYFYGIHAGLENSYFSGNIVTGNGMRSLDFASRSLWGNFLPDMFSISIWAISVLFAGAISIHEAAQKVFGKHISWLSPLLLITSGPLVGLWTEAYLSRWYVGACALIVSLLISLQVLSQQKPSHLFIWTILALTASQIVIVPVFLSVPVATVIILLITLKKFGTSQLLSIRDILRERSLRITLSILGVFGLINILWLRNFKTTLSLASEQLDGIVKWIVLPYYNTPKFAGTLSGLIPWHSIPESRWGVPSAEPGLSAYQFVVEPARHLFANWTRVGLIGAVSALVIALMFINAKCSKVERMNVLIISILPMLVVAQGVLNVKLSARSLYAFLMYFVTLAPALVAVVLLICIYLIIGIDPGQKISRILFVAPIALALVLNATTSAIELTRWNDKAQHILNVEAISQLAVDNGMNSVQLAKVEPMTDYEYVYIANVLVARLQDLGATCSNCVQQENRISSVDPISDTGNENLQMGTVFIGGKCSSDYVEVSRYQWITLCQ